MKLAAKVMIGALAMLAGCNSNSMMGSHTTTSRPYFGKLRINGNLNNVTVENSSRLYRLSIFGDANFINFQDDVTCNKIEIWGENNRISVPESLIIRVNEVGKGNLIERRSAIAAEPETRRLRAARVTTTYTTTYPRYSPPAEAGITPAPESTSDSGMTTYYSTPEGATTAPPAASPAPSYRVEPAPAPGPSDDSDMIEMEPM
ncbi:MAG: hypothetical protein KDA32_12055 [Phycisphaerales bacterium]|nr:hypothetical protein [Phycisphaerales bacterium]